MEKNMSKIEEPRCCPNCGLEMKTEPIAPIRGEEERLLREWGVDSSFINSHIDVYRSCKCGYKMRETWLDGKFISSANFW